MMVRYIHESPLSGGGKQASNIMWDGAWPMKSGKFPDEHPCIVHALAFERLKQLGYWANPFPEGDGITLDPKGRTIEEVIKDIQECLGWEVANHRGQ